MNFPISSSKFRLLVLKIIKKIGFQILFFNFVASLTYTCICRRCNSHRKWKNHLMSRHKYLIVIGTVLFVDILFLFPYSAIQMVAFLHLHNMLIASNRSTLIRWGLQVILYCLKILKS